VASSRRLRRVEAENGRVDATGCVGPFYPKIIIFYVLGPRGNLVFLSFAWAYKRDPRGVGLCWCSYKYDTWRILPVKCCIDNSVRLRSCIRNINKHFWPRCRGGSQYLLFVYRLYGIILTSIISLTYLSVALWLFVVVTGKCFVGPESSIVHHSFPRFTSRFMSTGLLGSLIRQVSKKSNCMDPRMSFMHLADETLTEAWERYHGFMTDLLTVGMED
jgi:hypothetical protein